MGGGFGPFRPKGKNGFADFKEKALFDTVSLEAVPIRKPHRVCLRDSKNWKWAPQSVVYVKNATLGGAVVGRNRGDPTMPFVDAFSWLAMVGREGKGTTHGGIVRRVIVEGGYSHKSFSSFFFSSRVGVGIRKSDANAFGVLMLVFSPISCPFLVYQL